MGVVTRRELAGVVGDVLDGSSARSAKDLVAHGVAAGARPAVLGVLNALPEGEYRRLVDLWPHLADMPVGV